MKKYTYPPARPYKLVLELIPSRPGQADSAWTQAASRSSAVRNSSTS